MKINSALSIISIFTLISCQNDSSQDGPKSPVKVGIENNPTFKNKGQQLVYEMTQKVGDYSKLVSKKDVTYTYSYKTPDGKMDISTEKYLFNGELSYGKYKKHERTLANIEGEIEQGYDGSEFWLKQNGKLVTDTVSLKRVAFNRPTNFYWFTMMQKLLDPGLKYEYLKDQTIDGANYDVVKVSFESKDNKPTDVYQLYINKDTKLVDQFLFTVMDFGKTEPSLMELTYEKVDGLLLPTKRRYKSSNWDAEVTNEPWIEVNWSDVKFDTGLKKSDFKKEIK